jgi:hypothetical protein
MYKANAVIEAKNLVPQHEVWPCIYPTLRSIPPLNVPRSPLCWITPGYCWSTPKCRNLGVQDAVFEGKKAEETAPRKSTPRTLKLGRLRARSFRPFLPASSSQVGLLPPSPLGTDRESFPSISSSLINALLRTRFHHLQLQAMHLPMAFWVKEHQVFC